MIGRQNSRWTLRLSLVLLLVGAGWAEPCAAQTVARCGKGWLELIDGYPVLHLKGSHYEMGYQQGALLRESVRK
ncbi:MAG: peptidase C45, partial [Planctomycetales bacterium]